MKISFLILFFSFILAGPAHNPYIEDRIDRIINSERIEYHHTEADGKETSNLIFRKINNKSTYNSLTGYYRDSKIHRAIAVYDRNIDPKSHDRAKICLNNSTRKSNSISFELPYNDLLTENILVVKKLRNRITGEIKNRLNLDVVKLSEKKIWRRTSILFGKYLTGNLFLSYKKQFSVRTGRKAKPDRISLKYQLSRFILIQASHSGKNTAELDVFWKFDRD